MRRFPLRTLLLMLLALIVFVRMWIVTHRPQEKAAPPPGSERGMTVDVAPPSSPAPAPAPSSPACNTLDRVLEAALRGPEDARRLADAQKQLAECPEPPSRACELGPALEARAPLAGPPSGLRGLLEGLCGRCPAQSNPCAGFVGRALLEGTASGRAPTPEELRWNLEHAGPGKAAACAVLVREVLLPLAITGGNVKPAHPALRDTLAPPCAQAGHLPAAVVSAAVAQQGAQADALAGLATAPAGSPSSMAPGQITGAAAGRHAFDGSETSGVDLGNAVTGKRWEADGALRAQYEPPLKQLASVRVRAKGPGTLRAIVRTPAGTGLEDHERGTHFVNPTVCRFQGTGQWETCTLKAPLLDVEALSVFPAQPKISLYEVEARGTR